eukprot:4648986-Pleurochrysis_carterae.AAC.5
MMSSTKPSITAAGKAAACSKKARTVGHSIGSTLRMCMSEPIAGSSIRASSQIRAIARTAAMIPLEPKLPRRPDWPLPPGKCASWRSAGSGRCNGCVDEEDVVVRAADGQHVLDGVKQLIDKGFPLLALELRIEPLSKLCADGIAHGRVDWSQAHSIKT